MEYRITEGDVAHSPWLYKRVNGKWEPFENSDLIAAIKMVRRYADFLKDGENNGDDGEPFYLENDDAVDTLQSVISEARELFGLNQFNEPTQED